MRNHLRALLWLMSLLVILGPPGAADQRRPPRPAQKPPAPKPAPPQPTADIAILNGRVFAAQGWAEAIAIRGDRIALVGANAEVRKAAGPETKMIDAAGHLVVPGFNDAHAHVPATAPGVSLPQRDSPMPDPTFKEVLKLVTEAAAAHPGGTWIFGSIGATVIDDAEATRFGLDEVSKEHPVLLRAWTGHGTFFNSAAMKALGLLETEPDPPGGFYTRLKKGGSDRTLSGFAHEYAEYQIARKLRSSLADEGIVDAFQSFADQAASFGVTSVQAIMVDQDAERVARALGSARLPVRLRLVKFPLDSPAKWQPSSATDPPPPSSMLSVWGTKWILDGTPIERLAYVRQDYSDRRRWRGQPNFPDASLRPMFGAALESREQLLLHASGDGAIEQAFLLMNGAGSALRWQSRRVRIEHGDLLLGDLIDRARRFGAVLVQNPSHFAFAEIFKARFGARSAAASPFKSAAAAGVPIAIGSDGPLSPGLNLMFATTHPSNPTEALSREEAVRAYTSGSAYAEFADHEKGTIAPGMLADIAVLSQDVFTVSSDALPATGALVTIVGGRIVHEKQP